MSKQVCSCKEDKFINNGNGTFDLSGRFINKFASINNNPRFNIISGKITNLNTNRRNCNTNLCDDNLSNVTIKQDKLRRRRNPTPYRVPYNHYRKRYTCNTNCDNNVKIIKENNCSTDCQKTTYGITRLVNKDGVRLRNNGGNYINYLQSNGKLYKQNAEGIVPLNKISNKPHTYKLMSGGTVYNQNLNTQKNDNCMITNQKANSLTTQSFLYKKIPTSIRKYRNKEFSSRTSVSSRNRLQSLKYNTILAGQITKEGYNSCINGQLCSKYFNSGPNNKKKLKDETFTNCPKKKINSRERCFFKLF